MEKIKKKLSELYSVKFTGLYVDGAKLKEYGLTDISLRPYQVDGVNWLVERYHRGHGCILGDEMGLGKTCQTISLLVALYGSKETRGPHLVLSPLSVLANWQNELARFAPKLKVKSYVGDKEARGEKRNEIEEQWDEISVVLTTYEICLKDETFLRKFSWHTLIVDEAHRLKNRESLLHKVLLDFDFQYHVLLTGTPVQNNLKELYALLCFVAPRIFRERYEEEFVERFTSEEGTASNKVTELHDLLQPLLLRRIKSEVIKDLPKKSEVVLFHGMSALQKKYYKAILTKDTEAFENPNQTSRTRLMNILMQLRKCVDHPYLFDGVEPEPFELGEHLVEASGKLVLIDQLLTYLKPRGHKVLMFSQMTRMLDIIQDYLGYRGYTYERLDGSVRGEERYLAIQNFNEDEGTFIFLLSTKAGGQGLNLVAADTVIFVDSDYNPQNDLQAAARAHRIGQTRPVKIMRLIGRSTVEEIVLRRAEAKLKLTNAVIEGGHFSLGASNKEDLLADNNIQLQDILKFGVDQLLSDEESSIEDLDFEKILGPTIDGEWKEDTEKETEAGIVSESMEVDNDDKEGDTENMYVFEGTDYSKEPSASDRKVFEELISVEKAVLEEEVAQGRALRKNKGVKLTSLFVEPVTRKPRKQLTEEEKEERKKKRAETAARKAKEAEEEEVRLAQERRRKREEMWEANGYTSVNLPLDSEGESEEDEEEEILLDDESERLDISYVVGDVTHPTNTGTNNAIVVHCVDDSGRWGSGGMFSAVSARSLQPEEFYTQAGRMKDLALGDAHLIPIDDLQSRNEGNDFLALIIAQHRDKKYNLSGIKLSALSQGLQRIFRVAKKTKASVHLPRIGHNTPGFNWYGTERLIRKILASRGVPTYIYYYPRKLALKRKATSYTPDPARKQGKERRNSQENGKRQSDKEKPGKSLPIFMQGVSAFFFQIPDDQCKKLTRYLVAYDGEVHKTIGDETTNVVIPETITEEQQKQLKDLVGNNQDVTVVTCKWLEDCFSRKKKLDMDNYMLEEG